MKTMERFCYLGILSLVAIYILVFLPENSPIILDSSSSSYSASREIDDSQLSESFETKKSFQETSRLNEKHPENYDLIRTFCDMKFRNGLMCPPLYTELGASCSYNGSKAVCTDVRLKAKYSLRKSQLAITRMLGIFDLIASRHNITYWLTSGTLLGAVRHKGFIPWDSDADIEMPLKDYEKFFRIASHDLPSDVFFQNTESDPNLRPEQSYLYEGYKYKDIGMYIRIWNPRLRDTHSCNKVCLMYDCKFHDGLMVDMFIVESAPNGTFPLRDVLFEGLHFPVPNNYREVLSKLYGNDYMDVPRQGSKKRVQWDYPDPLLSCEEFKNLVERRKRNLKKKKLARKTHANSMESLRYLDLRRKNGGNSVVLK